MSRNRKQIDKLLNRFPALSDAKVEARKRLPTFVWEYLDSATGSEISKEIDRKSFDNARLETKILMGEQKVSLGKTFLNELFSAPFGIGPVGMSGLIHPQAELKLAKAALDYNIPYTLPTLGTQAIEDIMDVPRKNKWFQLYCPEDPMILHDLIQRALSCDFDSLVITVDLPASSIRERQLKAGLTLPPKINSRLLAQLIMRPRWSTSFLLNRPLFKTLSPYSPTKSLGSTKHIGYQMRTNPDLNYLKRVRDLWPKKLIVKGVTAAGHMQALEALDIDAVWVSNHGGRQFQSGVASLQSLSEIRDCTDIPIIFDGGIESGLDVIKAYSKGANFVMMSRSWHYCLAAFRGLGIDYLYDLMTRDISANLSQMGCSSIDDIPLTK